MLSPDKKAKLVLRKSRPQTLASSFGGLMDTFGVRASDADLVANWQSIVGNEISNISKVIAIRTLKNNKFNIVLCPISPAFAMELSYKIDDCISKINGYYGRDAVAKITIRKRA
jgi:hypothetical protein